ncbi:hypothetical protein [Paraburkholderia acidipaludis]|uniref:hypothetical protein n=1 Tax=Paraburkholderia acidipaludis TaxID=660537 RepID=UPI0012EB9F13|nr:hypothetical protein [Paraburkholderia acidipaludis]
MGTRFKKSQLSAGFFHFRAGKQNGRGLRVLAHLYVQGARIAQQDFTTARVSGEIFSNVR